MFMLCVQCFAKATIVSCEKILPRNFHRSKQKTANLEAISKTEIFRLSFDKNADDE